MGMVVLQSIAYADGRVKKGNPKKTKAKAKAKPKKATARKAGVAEKKVASSKKKAAVAKKKATTGRALNDCRSWLGVAAAAQAAE